MKEQQERERQEEKRKNYSKPHVYASVKSQQRCFLDLVPNPRSTSFKFLPRR